MSLIRYLSVVCCTDARKPPMLVKGQHVNCDLTWSLEDLSRSVLNNGTFLEIKYHNTDYDDDHSIMYWYGRHDEDSVWRMVKDEGWMDYVNLCCVIRLSHHNAYLHWNRIGDISDENQAFSSNSNKNYTLSLFTSIQQEGEHIKKDSLLHSIPTRSIKEIVPFMFKFHSSILSPHLQLEIKYDDELTTGQGVTNDIYQQFWDFLDDPSLALFKTESRSNCLIPQRHTSTTSLKKLEIIGRIIIASMRHEVYPTRLHPICFGLLPESSIQVEEWIQDSFPEWTSLYPRSYQDWIKIDRNKRQLIEAQYHLDRIMDEFELNDTNYAFYRIQVFKELLINHRDISIQAIRRGMDSMLKPSFIYRCGVTESYKEWQSLNILIAEDVWDRIDLCRDPKDSDEVAIQHDLVYFWLKDCILSMSNELLHQFHVFVTGNQADRRRIQVYINDTISSGYPVAFACSPSITFRHNYQCYEELQKELEWTIHEMTMTLT